MATKTISIETDVYSALKKEKGSRESFSQVIRRVMAERPVDTLGELELALKGLEGIGAGRKRRRHAAARKRSEPQSGSPETPKAP